MNAKERLIVALDVDTLERAGELVDILSPEVDIFKVGIASFTAFGQDILRKLESAGKKVFLDLKVHDIPNTVSNAAGAAARQGVFMMNFHCLGGIEMLRAAVRGAREAAEGKGQRTILLGVTVLTSMSQEDMLSIGLIGNLKDTVLRLANLALRAGLDGVVASAKEAKLIKENMGKDFIVVTPGIRPEWAVRGDQKRVLTPDRAIAEGADYLVVGRPIIHADNPSQAAAKIIEEMVRGS